MNKKRTWNLVKTLLKLIVTGLLLWYVFSKINIESLKALVLRSDPWFIAMAFVVYASSLVIASWRNLGLLKDIGLRLPFWYYFRLYMLGIFYNVTLPGGVGGDGYKIYILRKRYQLPTKRLFLAMLFDRVSGLWAIGFITVSLIIFIPKIEVHPTLPIVLLLAGTGVYYLVMRRFFPDYAKSFLQTHFRAGMLQSMQVLVVILLLLSQDFGGKYSPYLFSFQLSTLAANIPASIGGAGLRESAMINAANYFGMSPHLAVFLSISFYLISTLIALGGSLFMIGSNEFESAPSEEEAKRFEEHADRQA